MRGLTCESVLRNLIFVDTASGSGGSATLHDSVGDLTS